LSTTNIEAIALRGIPEVRPGDDLADLIVEALRRARVRPRNADILIVKHKIVSKAEGRIVRLADVVPSPRARRWAAAWGHDARVLELALRDARRVVRAGHGVLITETRHGFICANSGLDLSNVDGGASAVLLPEDPDASAARLRRALRRRLGVALAVIVADSFGRPWREGLTEVALGCAGVAPLHDLRGHRDPYGYTLHATEECVADELACLAGLACGKLQRTPACLIRGFRYRPGRGDGKKIIRPVERDLFR